MELPDSRDTILLLIASQELGDWRESLMVRFNWMEPPLVRVVENERDAGGCGM